VIKNEIGTSFGSIYQQLLWSQMFTSYQDLFKKLNFLLLKSFPFCCTQFLLIQSLFSGIQCLLF